MLEAVDASDARDPAFEKHSGGPDDVGSGRLHGPILKMCLPSFIQFSCSLASTDSLGMSRNSPSHGPQTLQIYDPVNSRLSLRSRSTSNAGGLSERAYSQGTHLR